MGNKPTTERNKKQSQPQTHAPIAKPISPPIQANVETSEPNDGAEYSQRQIHIAEPSRFSEWMKTWLPIILNGILLVIIIFQWKAMENSLSESIATREIENRAYFGMRAGQLLKEPAIGQRLAAVVVFTNAGETPAINVKTRAGMLLRENPLPAQMSLNPSDTILSSSVILPGVDLTLTPVLPELNEQQVKQITDRRAFLYVYGTYEYDDMFGHHYVNEFCVVNSLGGTALQPCADHNTYQ